MDFLDKNSIFSIVWLFLQFRKFYIPHKNAPNSTTSRFKINGPLKRHAVDQILRQRLTIFWSKTSKAFTFSKKHLDYVAKNRFETILSECTFIFHSKSFCPIFHVTVGTFIPLLSRTFYGTDATKKRGRIIGFVSSFSIFCTVGYFSC